MAYEIKRNKDGKLTIYKDGKRLGVVNAIGDDIIKEENGVPPFFYRIISDTEIDEIKKAYPEIDGYGVVLSLKYPKEKEGETVDFLTNYCGEGETLIKKGDGESVIFKRINAKAEERAAINLYAKVLAQSVFEETGEKITVGVGNETKSPENFYRSYAEAVEAVKTAKDLKETGEVFFYRDFAFYNILKEQPRVKAIEYLSLILSDGALKVFSDKELIKTAEVFFKHDLNLSETARELYVHRNTLTYRLDRIERITGLNIRNFKDAVTFKTAKTLFGLSKNEVTY